MPRLIPLCGALCLVALAACDDTGPQRVDLCDLAKAPAAYFDKPVKIEGRLTGSPLELTSEDCPGVSVRTAAASEFPTRQRYKDALDKAREEKQALDVDLVVTPVLSQLDKTSAILVITDVADIELVDAP